ncbi:MULTISPECIES: hypothetical protein [Thiorhodovibrio]|uniref:hypothetical protein n=1 Tax=Thiorhodovibrio TaxID=61593 RepID=UPI00191415FC|nr:MULTISPECIES: hypothetical protein [Thiorhodovibrio]WPL15053.1 hypothetical protein Thiosp_04917 [Thiorhodovibrio litoralis]
MTCTFVSGLTTPIADVAVQTRAGYALPYPTALMLAGRPSLEAVSFGAAEDPYLALFGGAVVAMQPPSGGTCAWWPVADAAGAALSLERMNPQDIVWALDRARALAVALNCGVGLCGLAGDQDPRAFLERLQARDGSASTMHWAAAYAAAKRRLPDLVARVEWFEEVDPHTGAVVQLPARRLNGRWEVTVCVQAGRLLQRSSVALAGATATAVGWYHAWLDALGRGCAELAAHDQG